ncbi:DUF2218 domain-containing protein [Xanthobacteraceae bacterium A53D]
MSHTSTARVPTQKGDAYIKQLAKHWSHKLEVTHADSTCTITFPRDMRGADWPAAAHITLTADGDVLVCTIHASAEAQLDGLKEVLASHLDRFAFREAPLAFNWH